MNKIRFHEHLLKEDLLKKLDKKGSINLIELLYKFYNLGIKDQINHEKKKDK